MDAFKAYLILEEEKDDDYEPLGPNFWFHYDNEKYPAWSSPRGRLHTAEYDLAKFNRFAKIGEQADDLEQELKSKVKNDPKSMEGRCAYASLLMMKHGIRVGNETSAEGYVSGLDDNKGEIVKTYGVSTLVKDHVRITNGVLNLHFLGKTQVEHDIEVIDDFMVRYGKFYYSSNNAFGNWLGLDYDHLFKFVRDHLGDGFIPKDFRTFCGNVAAWDYIKDKIKDVRVETATEANKIIKEMVQATADTLGNTEGVAKSSYLDYRMIDWVKDKLMDY